MIIRSVGRLCNCRVDDDLQANFESKLFLMELPEDGRDGGREKRYLGNAFLRANKSPKILAFAFLNLNFPVVGDGWVENAN